MSDDQQDEAVIETKESPAEQETPEAGEAKLTGEARIDALCLFLSSVHGINVPYEIAPKE